MGLVEYEALSWPRRHPHSRYDGRIQRPGNVHHLGGRTWRVWHQVRSRNLDPESVRLGRNHRYGYVAVAARDLHFEALDGSSCSFKPFRSAHWRECSSGTAIRRTNRITSVSTCSTG